MGNQHTGRADIAIRFWSHVPEQPEEGCWEWHGSHCSRGLPYGQFTIDRGGSRWKTEMAHRIAYELAYGPPEGQVLHHCDNPPCVRPSHLYDGTHKQNMADRTNRGRTYRGPRANVENIPRGERNTNAKLTEAAVREIRALYAAGGISQQALADWYGVNQTKISDVVRRKTWKHVT